MDSNKSTQYIKVRSLHYEVNGEAFYIPVACIECHEKGLILMYDHGKHRLDAMCGPREDAKGRYINGCNKVPFAIPMTYEQFRIIVHDPHTTDYFFYMDQIRL